MEDRFVGVVGFGQWGRNLTRNFFQLGSLKTICDSSPERLEVAREIYPDVGVTTRFEDLLADPAIKALVIAVPAESHAAVAKRALEADRDVFVEKPLAVKLEDGRLLCRLAKEREKILMVGHLLAYHPAAVKLTEMVCSGELGRINYIYSNRLNLGRVRQEENILWSFAPHDISQILRMVGEMPTTVSAEGGNYLHPQIADVTVTHLNFATGIKAHIFVSWLHPYKEQRLVVIGDRKMACFDDVAEDKLLVYPHVINWIDHLPVPTKAEAQKVEFDQSEPLRLECEHFLHCVRTRQTPRTDGEEGLRVLEVLDACQRSLEGKSADLKPPVAKEPLPYYVHPTAVVDQPCQVGDGTKIWHFSHVMKNSQLGKGCILGQNVHVAPDVVMGNNVKVQNNVSIYTGCILEDDVFCGPSMVFTNVSTPRSHVNRHDAYEITRVKQGASLGANSTVVCGTEIGRFAFVAAGAVVTKDIPDFALVMGVPARVVGWVCWCGVRLTLAGKGGPETQVVSCEECGRHYRLEGGRLVLIEEVGVPSGQ